MTWAEYQDWRTEAQQLIAAALAKARLSVSGPGLSLQDGLLSARTLPVEDAYTKPVPTWGLKIWMRYRLKMTGDASYRGATRWDMMATVSRLSRPGSFTQWYAAQDLVFWDFPPDEPSGSSSFRELELEVSVRSYERYVPDLDESYEQSLYRLPVRLALSVMRKLPDNTYVEDRTEDFLLRRAPQKRTFSAQQPNTFYKLDVKSITKI